jgi:hypothetical protein
MKTLLDIVMDEMEATKLLIAKSYNDKGLKASGKFERSLEVVAQQNENMIKSKILGAYHTYFMESGRQPNKEKTIQQARGLGKILEQWVKDKGISVNPYAAAWKIVREGIKVPNPHNPGGVISDVVNDSWLDNIASKLREQIIEQIQSDVLKQWQQSQ